ncbi:enhanced intracellular survival protein Eis [Mycolicibacterium celeriflavum]|uniref:enhanced intracellular survival protein Eis n=1 Tax=Mycolicibacterium celeriflavum TaxID=1249101 RepID=UPI003CF2B147
MPETDISVELRSATDADWPAIAQLDATCFGMFNPSETFDAWRALIPPEGSVLACDRGDVVGMAHYLDLRLTVPGGAVLPMAGVTLVAVAPTHRRRGLLRAMYAELHERIATAGYPLAGLTASEGGIYGRFGYGPATIEQELTVDRRSAKFRADAPDPGGVRVVRASEHRGDLAAIYERWRIATPGGLLRSPPLWDELLADREAHRRGGTAWFTMLHPDGYALYRVFGDDPVFVRVAELTAVTRDAHTALCRALLGLDLVETIRFATHPADPLPYLLTDARVARLSHQQDDLWLRLMDVPAALEARTYRAELSTVLEVSDGFRGDGGRYALDIRGGRARCRRTDAQPEVQVDHDVLGSLYLGSHRASAFAAANRLRTNNSEVVARLDEAFASDVPAELGFGF